MISIRIKIQPSNIFATGSNQFLPSVFLNYASRCTSEIIVMISYFCPSPGPCSSLSGWPKIVSVVPVFYKFIFIDHTILICTIIGTICCFLHSCFKDISICIQQICTCSLFRNNCGNYTSFIILTNICRISALFEIQPTLSIRGVWTKPSLVEHLSWNCTCRIKVI